MEETDSSNNTVVDGTWFKKCLTTETHKKGDKNYDLIEFEEPFKIEQKSLINSANSDKALKELSQKYVASTSCSSSQFDNNTLEEIIVLSDSTNEEECDINAEAVGSKQSFKHKMSWEMDKDNIIFVSTKTNQSNGNQEVGMNSKKEIGLNLDISYDKDELNDAENNSRNLLGSKQIRNRKHKNKSTEEKTTAKKVEKTQKNEPTVKEKSVNNIGKDIQKYSHDKCLKDVIVNIDDSVFNEGDYGDCIKRHLDNSCISYRMRSSLSGMISWSRRIQTIENLVTHETEREEKHYLLILMPNQFGSLMQLMYSIKEHTDFYHLTVLVYGLSKPTYVQEEELLEVEMFFSTVWQFATNKEDIGLFILMATKSVAQIPFKIEKEEKYKIQNEYFQDSNKDVVKVDKKGNGLSRLWCQMLTMFPLARLETAEAITAVYPTLSSLFQAYEDVCETGEELIQGLPIRRAQGPLASIKKLGPELSRKCYKYFTSDNNIVL